MTGKYNRADKLSILEYSKQLLHKTLEEAIAPDRIDEKFQGKGSLGQLVEKYFFGYDINSNQEADFHEAGLELKCTPLKELAKKTLAIKERLVLTMIDYDNDYKKKFEESRVDIKCMYMLILFYLHVADTPVEKLEFIYSVLWKLPEKDLLIMKQDYETIIGKIRAGKAHELSEGDTTYLGACRKGQKGEREKEYHLPDGSVAERTAPKRAFSLKTQYMRTILEFAEKTGGQGTFNTSSLVDGYGPHLVSEAELANKTFEEILIDRFLPFYGDSYPEICQKIGMKETHAKQRYAMASNGIITENKKRGNDANKSDEFIKSGIRLKTFRINKDNEPEEALSFENIDYLEIVNEEDWFDSRLYELFTSRFLFVIFKENIEDGESVYRLKKSFFWTMPQNDLADAEIYWDDIKGHVLRDEIDPKYFYKDGDGKKFHVRPKAQKAANLAPTPSGGMAKKYCYWFNKSYVKQIVETELGNITPA